MLLLHLAVRAITLEKDMDKQELRVKLKTFRLLMVW